MYKTQEINMNRYFQFFHVVLCLYKAAEFLIHNAEKITANQLVCPQLVYMHILGGCQKKAL